MDKLSSKNITKIKLSDFKKIIAAAVFFLYVGLECIRAESFQQIPAHVKSVAEAKAGGQKISSWVTDKSRGKYIATILSKDLFQMIEVDLKGNWLRTSEALQTAKVPAPIMNTIKKEFLNKGFEADNYTLTHDHKEGTFYLVEISSDDFDYNVHLNNQGKILRKENR